MDDNKISWTKEQAHVIDTRCGNLLVSAAAGSGKTAVLVERIIEMVTGEDSQGNRVGDGMDIDELLVVTFTNAAAAQMKEKIGRKLQKKIDDAISDTGVCDDHLIRQLTLINHADICTIDSFCLRIVKEYFSKVGIDSAFDIGDDTALKLLRQEVMDEVLEKCYADETVVPGFLRLVNAFSKQTRDERIAELVFKTADVVSSYPEPEKWLEEAGGPCGAATAKMLDAFTRDVLCVVESARDMARECAVDATPENNLGAYGEKIDMDILMFNELLRCADEDSSDSRKIYRLREIYDRNTAKNQDADGKAMPRAFAPLGRAPSAADETVRESVSKRRKKYVALVKGRMDMIQPESVAEGQNGLVRPLMTTLTRLVRFYIGEFMKVKRDRNIFEFHDIEEFAFRILCSGMDGDAVVVSDIGREVSARYREILIDEYQDSNFLQEYILASVAGHGEGLRNIFMVGDVKQSIYRFRMARPDLFIGKYDSYHRLAAGEKADGGNNGNSILLTRNFRSEVNVLRTVNAVFAQLMRRQIGGIEYSADAYLHSRYAMQDEDGELHEPREGECGSFGPKSEFILIQTDLSELDVDGFYGSAAVEASYIASKIDELVNGAVPAEIGSGDDKRPVRYGDIVILLRSVSTVSGDFEKAFEMAGIPLYVESEKGYFDAAEISTLMSMLSIVDNSYIDYDMAAALRSPLAGLDDEELAVIAGEYRNLDGVYYSKVRLYMSAHEGEDTDIMRKLVSFMDMLSYLKKNKKYMSISDIIRYVLSETGYYWFAGARPMGKRRQANIDMLIKQADDFEKNTKGIFNFIRYVNELRTHDLDFAEANIVGGDENVVRVMTMHKSKGLEFPVVFVSGLGREINMMDGRTDVLIHPDYFLTSNAIDTANRLSVDSFYKKVMASVMKTETYAEEMRVLYVAMTRAKEKLYMTAGVSSIEKFKEDCGDFKSAAMTRMGYAAIMETRRLADWIYGALLYVDYGDFLELHEAYPESFVEDTKEVRREHPRASEVEAGVLPALLSGLDFTYGHRHSGLKSKMSITEIKKLQAAGEEFEAENDLRYFLGSRTYVPGSDEPVPEFLKGRKTPQGNEIGTVYHKIMELADFAATADAGDEVIMSTAKAGVQRVFTLGLFGSEYRDLISGRKVYNMLKSGLGRRMAAAAARGELFCERQFYMSMSPREIMPGCESGDDETVVVQGIIDAYFVEDGELVLMDYKTDTVREASELSRRYHVQLDKYADVLERLTGMKVKEKIIYSFCLDTTVTL